MQDFLCQNVYFHMSIRSVVLTFALLKLMKINAMIYASGGKKDCSTNLSDITVKQNTIEQ